MSKQPKYPEDVNRNVRVYRANRLSLTRSMILSSTGAQLAKDGYAAWRGGNAHC